MFCFKGENMRFDKAVDDYIYERSCLGSVDVGDRNTTYLLKETIHAKRDRNF